VADLDARTSETPIEKEYRAICEALARVPAEAPAFDRAAYSAKSIAKLIAGWRLRMEFEHRSSMVFAQLAGQLYEANATLDAKVVMLRMAQDELRHTETCARVVAALGGEPTVETELEVQPLARHAGIGAEERALRNVVYTTCCSEMIACARFVATLDRTRDPFLRHALRTLLADEILHGQFGFHYLEAWSPWLAAHPEVARSLERYLVHAFAVIEGELAPKGTFATLGEEESALGIDDPTLAREVFYGTMEGAVVPGLSRFGIDAATSWRERKRLA
jgi:hypothetical protein